MSNDTGPKTAYELAMERLRKKDAEAGIETRSLSDETASAVAAEHSQSARKA